MEREPLLGGRSALHGSQIIVDFTAGKSLTDSVLVTDSYCNGGGDREKRISSSGMSASLLSNADLSYGRRSSGISDAETVLHVIKGNIGTGIIGLPFAFMYAGFAVGFVSMALVCVVAVWCMLMLVRASHHLCELHGRRRLDYASTAELGVALVFPTSRWPQCARWVVNGFLVMTQLGFTAIYFVFISKNMQQVLLAMRIDMDYHVLIAIFVPIMIAGVWIRDLKTTAIFSGIGSVLQVVSLVIIIVYLCTHLDWSDTRLYPKKVTDMALFFGLAAFSVEGIGVILPLENDMNNRHHFPPLLICSMTFVSTLLLLVGSLGFVCFGDDTVGSITLNLPGGSASPSNIPFIYVKLFYTFAIMSSYLVQFYVAIEIIEPYVCQCVQKGRKPVVSYSLRAALVVGAAGLAAGVPDLGLFISLVGAAGSSTLAFIFPGLIHLAVFWHTQGVLWKLRNIVLAIVGTLGMLCGTYATVVQLVHAL